MPRWRDGGFAGERAPRKTYSEVPCASLYGITIYEQPLLALLAPFRFLPLSLRFRLNLYNALQVPYAPQLSCK